ncbi:MAG: hypothetical protein IID41_13475 [Planctomycetes bacterium]|nr:hypothetical protein [Planctomycetota bacterium]
MSPDNLTPEVGVVDLHRTEFDSAVLESEAPETVPGEVLDSLEALEGCWGSFVTRTCGTDYCFWECQDIRVLSFQESSFGNHHYVTPSFMLALNGTYELSADDQITVRYETETYFDGTLVTRPWRSGSQERRFVFTRVGDLLIEYTLSDGPLFLRRIYKRFDCPTGA